MRDTEGVTDADDLLIPLGGRYTGIFSLRSLAFHAALQQVDALTWSRRVSRC